MAPAWKLATSWLAVICPVLTAAEPQGLVDLGYAKQVPTFVNTTTSGKKVAIYKNIRFANAPTGRLRFRLPDTKLTKVDGIQDGTVLDPLQNHCISSAPAYVPFPPYNGKTWGHEDCLFLDVYVPEGVKPGDKVPVLHFLMGSAFAFGSKEMFVNPLSLFEAMNETTKFIYVVNNYRLGLPGWTYLPGQDMVANLGMHDCLAAAEWTSKYIHLFGGDADGVTISGQSAGAGIIGLLTVLNGGKGELPFQQAWALSPDIPPRRNPIGRQRQLFQSILDEANCTSLECLRFAPEQAMLRLNNHFINDVNSDAGGGLLGPAPGFGPVPDGKFIPDTPQALWQAGKFHKLRSLVLGNCANEGMGTSSDTGMPEAFGALVRRIFSTASNATVAYIESHYDFADNPAKLAWDWTTDVIFGCNSANIAAAYKDRARRYIFSAPPAVHAQDLSYMFYMDQSTTPVESVDDARVYQRNLLNFLHQRPIGWPIYGTREQITNITSNNFKKVLLPADLRARCDMVNRVTVDPGNGA